MKLLLLVALTGCKYQETIYRPVRLRTLGDFKMDMLVSRDNNSLSIIDTHFTVKCPHCNAISGISAISIPRYELLERYRPKTVGIGYHCNSCHQSIFLKFSPIYDFGNSRVRFENQYYEVEVPQENYEFDYLPEKVQKDFREALTCYSNSCLNAFAAMCRRTIQSSSSTLGAKGKDKVQHQISDLKSILDLDEETFDALKAIIISGHDGAHPHLPELADDRAEILLELMKDVLYQLFIRKKKIEEANKKRKIAIQQQKEN